MRCGRIANSPFATTAKDGAPGEQRDSRSRDGRSEQRPYEMRTGARYSESPALAGAGGSEGLPPTKIRRSKVPLRWPEGRRYNESVRR